MVNQSVIEMVVGCVEITLSWLEVVKVPLCCLSDVGHIVVLHEDLSLHTVCVSLASHQGEEGQFHGDALSHVWV